MQHAWERGKPERKRPLRILGRRGKIILKCILEK
jgi:hypothetical protein